jgi:hypothetical protein
LGYIRGRCDITAVLHSLITFSKSDVVSVSVSPSQGYGVRTNPGSVTTGNLTATASGGQSPYTYVWDIIDGSDAFATAATSATTKITNEVFFQGQLENVVQVTATDVNGNTAFKTVNCIFEVTSNA